MNTDNLKPKAEHEYIRARDDAKGKSDFDTLYNDGAHACSDLGLVLRSLMHQGSGFVACKKCIGETILGVRDLLSTIKALIENSEPISEAEMLKTLRERGFRND